MTKCYGPFPAFEPQTLWVCGGELFFVGWIGLVDGTLFSWGNEREREREMAEAWRGKSVWETLKGNGRFVAL